jgi:hypothetical protein
MNQESLAFSDGSVNCSVVVLSDITGDLSLVFVQF